MGKTYKGGKEAAKAKKAALKERLKKLKGKRGAGSVALLQAIGAVFFAVLAIPCLLALLCGCSTATPASRYTAATYGDITVYGSNNRVTLGDGAFAQADSQGSTETHTATPTNTTDIKPDVDVNTTGGKTAGVLEAAVSAGVSALVAPKATSNAASTTCAGGSCTDGACVDSDP